MRGGRVFSVPLLLLALVLVDRGRAHSVRDWFVVAIVVVAVVLYIADGPVGRWRR